MDFDAFGVFFGEFQPFAEVDKWQLVRDQRLDLNRAVLDEGDALGEGAVDGKTPDDL